MKISKKEIFFYFYFLLLPVFPLPVRFRVITQNKKKKTFEKIIKTSYEEMLSLNFPNMKQEQNLQTITLEDINADATMKDADNDGL
jgi:hypothetical protein